MKTMAKFFGLLVMLSVAATNSHAQQVGTIGVGDITFSAKKNDSLRSTEKILSALSAGINNGLTETRKFTVLDSAQLKTRINKQGRNLNDYYAKKYSGNALSQAGLDYILKADVTELGLFKNTRGKSENTIGLVDIDFELIGVADVTNDFSSSVTAQFSTRIDAGDNEAAQDVLDKAIQKAVDRLVDQLVSSLFPIRVMKIDESGAITLNYGEGLFEVGDTVLVYPLGTDIAIDKSAEPADGAVATLQIISTKRKFSTAQALAGVEALEKGQKGQRLLNGS